MRALDQRGRTRLPVSRTETRSGHHTLFYPQPSPFSLPSPSSPLSLDGLTPSNPWCCASRSLRQSRGHSWLFLLQMFFGVGEHLCSGAERWTKSSALTSGPSEGAPKTCRGERRGKSTPKKNGFGLGQSHFFKYRGERVAEAGAAPRVLGQA